MNEPQEKVGEAIGLLGDLLSRSSKSHNTESMAQVVELISEGDNFIKKLALLDKLNIAIPPTANTATASHATREEPPKEEVVTDSTPTEPIENGNAVFFCEGTSLMKYGKARNGGLYRKRIPLDRVEGISVEVRKLLDNVGEIKVKDIEGGFKDYEKNVVLLALAECGAIKVGRRGVYQKADSSSPDKWMERIKSLPKQPNLIDQYRSQLKRS